MVLAELLGLPHSTIIMQVEIQPGKVRVKRELEDGWFQHIEMPLPAVLTIQSGLNKLRYATLMGIKKAKTKEIKVISAAELGALPSRRRSSKRSMRPKRARRAQIFDGDAEDSCSQARREVALRGTRIMSVLAIVEQRMAGEVLAAAQQFGSPVRSLLRSITRTRPMPTPPPARNSSAR